MTGYEAVAAEELRRWGGRNAQRRYPVYAVRDAIMFGERSAGCVDAGVWNDRNISGSHPATVPGASLHAVARAWDIGVPNRTTGHRIADHLVTPTCSTSTVLESFGGVELIWNTRRWTREHGWRVYAGPNPHSTVLHLGFSTAWCASPASHDDLVRWTAHFYYQ